MLKEAGVQDFGWLKLSLQIVNNIVCIGCSVLACNMLCVIDFNSFFSAMNCEVYNKNA